VPALLVKAIKLIRKHFLLALQWVMSASNSEFAALIFMGRPYAPLEANPDSSVDSVVCPIGPFLDNDWAGLRVASTQS
jgi:hypothetical protein